MLHKAFFVFDPVVGTIHDISGKCRHKIGKIYLSENRLVCRKMVLLVKKLIVVVAEDFAIAWMYT